MYFLSQLLQLYKEAFAAAAGLSVAHALDALRLTSNLGQILFLAGVGAALWRANLAAGLSSSGVSGLVIASAGVGVLVLFEVVLLLAWFDLVTARSPRSATCTRSATSWGSRSASPESRPLESGCPTRPGCSAAEKRKRRRHERRRR